MQPDLLTICGMLDQGQRAASSASAVLIALTGIVSGVLLLLLCTRAVRASHGGTRAAYDKVAV